MRKEYIDEQDREDAQNNLHKREVLRTIRQHVEGAVEKHRQNLLRLKAVTSWLIHKQVAKKYMQKFKI